MIEHSELLRLLSYDPLTGIFSWNVNDGKKRIGKQAGNTSTALGYVEIRVNKTLYYAHRLAWFYVYGVWPDQQIDHLNNVRNDNRLSNLQQAGQSQNKKKLSLKNTNSSGFKGVCFDKRRGTYYARIVVDRKAISLGSFPTPQKAGAAYDAAAILHHGNFARTNKELGLL